MEPDWKKAEDYNFSAKTSLDRWAQEFLQRNATFIEEYVAARREQRERVLPHDDFPVGWSQTPCGKVLVKWGASPSFGSSFLDFEKFPRRVPGYKTKTAGEGYFRIAPELPDREVFEFDLSAPINPQIARAKYFLIAKQKQEKDGKLVVRKAIVSLYPWYLRTLDAMAAKVSSARMIEVFSKEYPEAIAEDTLRNWKREAQRLRDGGYREIVTAPFAPPGK